MTTSAREKAFIAELNKARGVEHQGEGHPPKNRDKHLIQAIMRKREEPSPLEQAIASARRSSPLERAAEHIADSLKTEMGGQISQYAGEGLGALAKTLDSLEGKVTYMAEKMTEIFSVVDTGKEWVAETMLPALQVEIPKYMEEMKAMGLAAMDRPIKADMVYVEGEPLSDALKQQADNILGQMMDLQKKHDELVAASAKKTQEKYNKRVGNAAPAEASAAPPKQEPAVPLSVEPAKEPTAEPTQEQSVSPEVKVSSQDLSQYQNTEKIGRVRSINIRRAD